MGHIVTGASVTTIASGIVCDVEIHDNGHTKPAEVVTPTLASKTDKGPNTICASTLNIAVVSPSDDEYQVAGRTFSTFSDAVEAAILAADSVRAQWGADNKVTICPPRPPDAVNAIALAGNTANKVQPESNGSPAATPADDQKEFEQLADDPLEALDDNIVRSAMNTARLIATGVMSRPGADRDGAATVLRILAGRLARSMNTEERDAFVEGLARVVTYARRDATE